MLPGHCCRKAVSMGSAFKLTSLTLHHVRIHLIHALSQVLKPTDSAGSDGVKLCQSLAEAKEHFHHLLTVEAVNGGYNTQVRSKACNWVLNL